MEPNVASNRGWFRVQGDDLILSCTITSHSLSQTRSSKKREKKATGIQKEKSSRRHASVPTFANCNSVYEFVFAVCPKTAFTTELCQASFKTVTTRTSESFRSPRADLLQNEISCRWVGIIGDKRRLIRVPHLYTYFFALKGRSFV